MQRRQPIQIATTTCAGIAAPRDVAAGEKLVPLKFTLEFRISGQVAPFLLALAKGYDREQGLEVTIDVGNGSVASITRVASGAYDMGFGDVSAPIEFGAEPANAGLVRAVYPYYNRAPFVIIGRKDRGLASDWKSVAAKRIGAASVESTRRAWPMAAKHLGLKTDAFEWITTDFSQRDNVILRGDVGRARHARARPGWREPCIRRKADRGSLRELRPEGARRLRRDLRPALFPASGGTN